MIFGFFLGFYESSGAILGAFVFFYPGISFDVCLGWRDNTRSYNP